MDESAPPRVAKAPERVRIAPSKRVDLEEERELKVRLPLHLHLKLHGLKITKGRGISEVVLQALEEYFLQLECKSPP